MDEAVEERIVRRAGGVPFFLASCAEAVRSGRSVEEVPWDLVQAVRQRVATLPLGGQHVLRAAALAGRVVPRSLLVALCDGPEELVLAGLDAACDAGLLRETPSHDCEFVHDLIREAVATTVGPGQRILLHRRIGEWLESHPEGVRRAAEIAWHFEQSGESERALPYALRAEDQAEEALAHVDTAVGARATVTHHTARPDRRSNGSASSPRP
jgi:predicted ATPase